MQSWSENMSKLMDDDEMFASASVQMRMDAMNSLVKILKSRAVKLEPRTLVNDLLDVCVSISFRLFHSNLSVKKHLCDSISEVRATAMRLLRYFIVTDMEGAKVASSLNLDLFLIRSVLSTFFFLYKPQKGSRQRTKE